jgi:hypothetical protein
LIGFLFMRGPQQSRPIFKAPTARASLLGLDKLAQQKREAEAAKASESQKKIKIDYAADEDQDEEMADEPTCKRISILLRIIPLLLTALL